MTDNRVFRAIEAISTRIAGPRQPTIYEASTQPQPQPARSIEGGGVSSYYLSERTAFREATKKTTVAKLKGITGLYSWYTSDGVVFASVNGLAEAAVGQGYHTEIDEDEPEKAKELVDEFGKVMNLDILLPNITKNMLIAGFCFVDTRITKFPKKCTLKIIHPKTVKEVRVNQDGSIDKIIQENPSQGQRDIEIDGQYLTLFVHNQIANDPTGTSIITPIETLLSTKRTAITNIDKIIEKRMFPDIIWKTTRDPAGLKELLSQKDVDEDLVLGWLEEGELQNVAQIVEIQGNTRYEGYIEHIDKLIYKGLYAPDLYFWKDATLASAKELTTMVDRNLNAIQRNISRGVEAGFFQRLMVANGLIAEPKMFWGVEKTGAEDLQMEAIISTAIQNGLIGPKQLTKLLQIMGLNIGELGWDVDNLPDDDTPEEEPLPDDEEEEPEPNDDEKEEKINKLYDEFLGGNKK